MIKYSLQSDSSKESIMNWEGAKVPTYGKPSVLAIW